MGGQVSAATSTNWVFNFAVSISFLSLVNALGKAATFFLLALVGLSGALWTWLVLPETKGKSLEEVEELFKRPGDVDPGRFSPPPSTTGSAFSSAANPAASPLLPVT